MSTPNVTAAARETIRNNTQHHQQRSGSTNMASGPGTGSGIHAGSVSTGGIVIGGAAAAAIRFVRVLEPGVEGGGGGANGCSTVVDSGAA
jgi:hypothetical protein